MASILRVPIRWTGFIGAPGYTNLYFRNATPGIIDQAVADDAAAKVEAWLGAWPAAQPNTVTIQRQSTLEEVNDTNGNLVGFWQTAAGTSRTGLQSGNYSATSGACVNWSTNTIRNSRRMRGRTFMVPLAGVGYDGSGTLSDTQLSSWRTASTTLHAASGASRLIVWGRPTTPGGTNGVSAEVTSSSISDKAAVLRSRRE